MTTAYRALVYLLAVVLGLIAGLWVNGYPFMAGSSVWLMLSVVISPAVVFSVLARFYLSHRTRQRPDKAAKV